MPSRNPLADPWPAYLAGWLALGAIYPASLAASGAPGDLALRAALLVVMSGAPVPADSIVRIQAAGDYAEVHAAAGTFLLHISLGELIERLDPARFEQVHRSHIVNLDAVRELRCFDDRRLVLRLRNGEEVVASRAASERLRRRTR